MLKKVLITGITRVKGLLCSNLSRDYEIKGLAPEENGWSTIFQGDIRNIDDILPAFRGQDCVVHLAADASVSAPWESILPNNIVGTYNVFEACRLNGVKRVVYARAK